MHQEIGNYLLKLWRRNEKNSNNWDVDICELISSERKFCSRWIFTKQKWYAN